MEPIIIYDNDFDRIRCSNSNKSDLLDRFYVARNKKELKAYLEKYKVGDLPSKYNRSFVKKYINPLKNENNGIKAAEYINKIIKQK